MNVHATTVPYRDYAEQVRKTRNWATFAMICAVVLIAVAILSIQRIAAIEHSYGELNARYETLRSVVMSDD